MPINPEDYYGEAPRVPVAQPQRSALQALMEQKYPGITEAINNPDNWKEAAIPRKRVPILPGEFMPDISKTMARVGLPESFGPYARAADDVSEAARRSFSNTINSVGGAIDPALDALRKYLSKF